MAKNILIVTPNNDLGELLRLSLEENTDHHIEMVTSSTEALVLFSAVKFQLVILDAELSDMPAQEIASKFRENRSSISILVVSPQNNLQNPEIEAIRPDGFISSPFFVPDLLEIVNQAVVNTDSDNEITQPIHLPEAIDNLEEELSQVLAGGSKSVDTPTREIRVVPTSETTPAVERLLKEIQEKNAAMFESKTNSFSNENEDEEIPIEEELTALFARADTQAIQETPAETGSNETLSTVLPSEHFEMELDKILKESFSAHTESYEENPPSDASNMETVFPNSEEESILPPEEDILKNVLSQLESQAVHFEETDLEQISSELPAELQDVLAIPDEVNHNLQADQPANDVISTAHVDALQDEVVVSPPEDEKEKFERFPEHPSDKENIAEFISQPQEMPADEEVLFLGESSTQASSNLVSLCEQLDAEACLIALQNRVWAFAGALGERDLHWIEETLQSQWERGASSELVQFFQSEVQSERRLLVASAIDADAALVMIFRAGTAFSQARRAARQAIAAIQETGSTQIGVVSLEGAEENQEDYTEEEEAQETTLDNLLAEFPEPQTNLEPAVTGISEDWVAEETVIEPEPLIAVDQEEELLIEDLVEEKADTPGTLFEASPSQTSDEPVMQEKAVEHDLEAFLAERVNAAPSMDKRLVRILDEGKKIAPERIQWKPETVQAAESWKTVFKPTELKIFDKNLLIKNKSTAPFRKPPKEFEKEILDFWVVEIGLISQPAPAEEMAEETQPASVVMDISPREEIETPFDETVSLAAIEESEPPSLDIVSDAGKDITEFLRELDEIVQMEGEEESTAPKPFGQGDTEGFLHLESNFPDVIEEVAVAADAKTEPEQGEPEKEAIILGIDESPGESAADETLQEVSVNLETSLSSLPSVVEEPLTLLSPAPTAGEEEPFQESEIDLTEESTFKDEILEDVLSQISSQADENFSGQLEQELLDLDMIEYEDFISSQENQEPIDESEKTTDSISSILPIADEGENALDLGVEHEKVSASEDGQVVFEESPALMEESGDVVPLEAEESISTPALPEEPQPSPARFLKEIALQIEGEEELEPFSLHKLEEDLNRVLIQSHEEEGFPTDLEFQMVEDENDAETSEILKSVIAQLKTQSIEETDYIKPEEVSKLIQEEAQEEMVSPTLIEKIPIETDTDGETGPIHLKQVETQAEPPPQTVADLPADIDIAAESVSDLVSMESASPIEPAITVNEVQTPDADDFNLVIQEILSQMSSGESEEEVSDETSLSLEQAVLPPQGDEIESQQLEFVQEQPGIPGTFDAVQEQPEEVLVEHISSPEEQGGMEVSAYEEATGTELNIESKEEKQEPTLQEPWGETILEAQDSVDLDKALEELLQEVEEPVSPTQSIRRLTTQEIDESEQSSVEKTDKLRLSMLEDIEKEASSSQELLPPDLLFPWEEGSLEELQPSENTSPTLPVHSQDPAMGNALDVLFSGNKPEPLSLSLNRTTYTCVLVPHLSHYSLTSEIARSLRDWLPSYCQANGWELTKISIQPTYLQWTIRVGPEISQGKMIRQVRQFTSQRIFETFSDIKKEHSLGDFWSPGYLAVSGAEAPAPEFLDEFIQKTRRQQPSTSS